MSDNKEDLDLQALQRELDDAFATTRPRRGYEDELWLRMQARRPLWTRLRDAIGSVGARFREAPAIPLGAVAVLLVVVVGAGILLNSGLRLSPTHSSYAQGAQAPDLALSEFGKLPTPALHPGLVPAPVSNGPSTSYSAALDQSNLYFGPATLRWTGQVPLQSVQAAIYRYAEPGASLADQFAASIGASSDKQVRSGTGFLGTYSGQAFILTVQPTEPQLPLEPYFNLAPTSPVTASGGPDSRDAAAAFLGRYSLVPSWPNEVKVQQSNGHVLVQYLRAFQLPGGGVAYLVSWIGQRYGASVDINNGGITAASGPLPLNLDATTYRLISNGEAVRMALASPPASSQAIQPVPAVDLKSVELVYALAFARGQGYYEPAYLFSGTFSYNGQTYTKRVLVPLVDPTLRS